MNLAPLRYRKLLNHSQSPISCVKHKKLENGMYEAYSYLDNDLIGGYKNKNSFYGNATGTGTDKYLNIALYKSISESLERWAYFECLKNKSHGTTECVSSTGFAAYPGFTSKRARHYAYMEAVERWGISHWWQDKLGCVKINDNAIEIVSPIENTSTVIVWSDLEKTHFRVYGFAAAINRKLALEKSYIELYRNQRIFEKSLISTKGSNVCEIRYKYFSSGDGKHFFDEKIFDSESRSVSVPHPKLLIDKEVVGNWSKFTTVWRCLFEDKMYDVIDDPAVKNYFIF